MTGSRSTKRDDRFGHEVYGSEPEESLTNLITTVDAEVEARGTFCPEPVIRMQDSVNQLRPGQTAMLLADDMGVEVDIPAWCISTGNEYLGLLREARFYRVFVRRC